MLHAPCGATQYGCRGRRCGGEAEVRNLEALLIGSGRCHCHGWRVPCWNPSGAPYGEGRMEMHAYSFIRYVYFTHTE